MANSTERSAQLTRGQVVFLTKAWQLADRALTPLAEDDPIALTSYRAHVAHMAELFPPGSVGTGEDPELLSSTTSAKVASLLATLLDAAEQNTWVGFADAAQFWETDVLWLAELIEHWAIKPQDLR